eukprot:RCo023080
MSWIWGSNKTGPSVGSSASSGAAAAEARPTPSKEPHVTSVSDNGIREIEDEDDFTVITTKDELDKLHTTIAAKDEENQSLHLKVAVLTTRHDSSEKAHKQEVAFKERQLAEKEEKISEMTRKVLPLERDLQSASQQLAQQTKAVEDLTEANSQLKAKAEALHAELGRTREHLKSLTVQGETQAQAYRSSLDDKVAEVTALTRKATELEDQLSEQRKSTLEATLKQHATHVKEGQAVSAMDMQLKAVQQQNNTLQTENKQLREELGQLRQAHVTLQGVHDQKLAELSRANDTLTTTVKQGKGQLEQAQKEVQATQSRCTGLAKQLRDKEIEVASLTGAAAKASEEAVKASELLKKRALEIEGLNLQLNSAKEERTLLQDQLSETTRINGELRKVISSQTQEMAKLRNRMQAMQETVEEITAAVDTTPQEDMKQAMRMCENSRAQVGRILKENPNSIPVRCVRDESCTTLPLLEKKKFAVARDMTLPKFIEHIRSKLGLRSSQALFVYLDFDGEIPPTQVLGELYQSCKNADGFLRLKYNTVSPR